MIKSSTLIGWNTVSEHLPLQAGAAYPTNANSAFFDVIEMLLVTRSSGYMQSLRQRIDDNVLTRASQSRLKAMITLHQPIGSIPQQHRTAKYAKDGKAKLDATYFCTWWI